MNGRRLCLSLWLALLSEGVSAFELMTHGLLTVQGYQRSALSVDASLLTRLGVDINISKSAARPFGDTYVEMSLSGDRPWTANRRNEAGARFDLSFMPAVPGFAPEAHNLTIAGWLARGAIREDDAPQDSEENPKYDTPSGSPINRVFNHFFDPARNRGLSLVAGKKAPDWATGYIDSFNAIPTRDTDSQQYFSVLKAREALYRALTLWARNPDGTFSQLLANEAPHVKEAERKRYWATTFRALGDVLHLVQDMAQPQHSRDEAHSGFGFHVVQALTGHKSVFEAYVDAKVRGDTLFTVKNYQGTDKVVAAGAVPLALTSYPQVPVFDRYSDFWSVSPGDAGRAGPGLADYSNRGFFTAGKNIGNTDYALPNPAVSAYSVSREAVTGWDGAPLNSSLGPPTVAVFRGVVPDTLDQSQTAQGVALSTNSGWDQFLQVYVGALPKFSLIHLNYDDQIRLLLPRAISYSAGLINYFFRGRLEVSLSDNGVYGVLDHTVPAGNDPMTGGFGKIKLKVRNLSSIRNDAQGNPVIEPMTTESSISNLVAVARFHRNTCYQADLSGEYGSSPRPQGKTAEECRSLVEEIAVSEPAAVPAGINQSAQPVAFTFTTKIPISATDLFLQVVYRGPLGNEPDAVVVETKDISEPTYVYNYSRWDQYMYAAYPSVSTGPYTYAQWCTQGGYAGIDECNQANGLTLKFAFSSDGNWIPGYDPGVSTIPQETWTNIAQEPTFAHLAKMVGPVGKFNRVAVLLDAVAANKGLVVQEWIDPRNPPSIFKWSTGTPVPTINQWDYSTGGVGTLTRSVSYLGGRGVFVRASEAPLLNDGTAQNIPPFILAPSEIALGW